MLVKDRTIRLGRFLTPVPVMIRIPKRWFKYSWNYWNAARDYTLKDQELVMILAEGEQRDNMINYIILPFRPYIEGLIPKNAIYYSEDKIMAYPIFVEKRISLDI